MRSDLIAELYEQEAKYWWHVAKREMVLALIGTPSDASRPGRTGWGIDIGCGGGYTVQALEPRWRMVGVDTADAALRAGRARRLPRLCRVAFGRSPLPFADETFDVITLLDVLEHLDDDLVGLAECRRILQRDGSLVITVPAYQALWSPWDEALGHRRRYTAPALAAALARAELSVRRLSYMFSFLLPAAALFRTAKRLLRHDPAAYASDFVPVPAVVNRLLIRLGRVEQWLVASRKRTLPFGLSVIAVATRR